MKLFDRITNTKNAFLLGFIISLLGALPLGYINIISLQILNTQGNWHTVSFISGIVFIEFFVLKAVSFGAKWLVEQKKLLLFIDLFTLIFFISIAVYFIKSIGDDKNFSLSQLPLAAYPFMLGLLLNSLNFIQWPYWSGIYIYLFRTKKLDPRCNDSSLFIIGAMIGTLVGMLTFAHSSRFILIENNIKINDYLNPIFATLFVILAISKMTTMVMKSKSLRFKV